MPNRTPVTVITGPLCGGKTTLLRHIVATVPQKLAILMNEFGEIAIDSQIVEGKNVRMAELGGGCVCCALIGEFEAAVDEIITTVAPDRIVVEATGVAEPDALIMDIQDNLTSVWLDGVIAVADADALVRFPQLGQTTRLQIEAADLILLNKADLVSAEALERTKATVARCNPAAPIIPTQRGRVDPDLLFGLMREREVRPPAHVHQPEFDSLSYTTAATLDRGRFEALAEGLHPAVYRAKGFVRFTDGAYLFNFVSGRWELEPFPPNQTALVFIGKDLARRQSELLSQLKRCEP
jgi:G3E family GTPase